MARTWDIFCSVVDNYGDIGVCWRLARQLSREHGQAVRLWVDNLSRLHQLCNAIDAAADTQRVDGVEVMRWNSDDNSSFPQVHPAEIVIEGFGVRPPASFVAAMAAHAKPPVWINLEYLSAEPWVDTHHGLPSAQPTLPLIKHFFFPGFTAATGGLLFERGLATERDTFQADARAIAEFRRRLGIWEHPHARRASWVSLFCYANLALPSLLAAWVASGEPVICVVPEGNTLAQVSAMVGRELVAGERFEQGSLTLLAIPFVEQDEYDRLLWMCDVNFVRGEDSFVRAQLAARPLVWQAYPQAEDAHLLKMRAFLERYAAGQGAGTVAALSTMFETWNGSGGEVEAAWAEFSGQRGSLSGHAERWAAHLARGKNLAATLVQFCENKLK
jgi:uncharacterized repeat protein (TIGR03837 family)